MGTKLKLFEDEAADDDVETISKVEINKEYAKRFEHNKKREDLQRLQELKKKGVVNDSDDESSSTSSSTSLDEDDITSSKRKKKDLEFFNALIKVRNQDPILKDKEAKLFHSESEDEEDNETDSDNQSDECGKTREKKNNKKKQMYLKDVMSRHLIEKGPEVESDSDDEEEAEVEKKRVKSYSEEQEELRKEFLRAVDEAEGKGNEGSEEGGELLKVKEKQGRGEEDEDDGMFGEKLNEYFGEDEKLDENEMFLKDYFRKRLWEAEDRDEVREDEEELGFLDDEEEIERQEDYEREFNFRFEENAGDRVIGHSRKVEGSVRKKTSARKSQRERKEERMAQAELERKEELKRLKNLKKKEINEKLQKIRETAGIGEDGICPLDADDLEKEFDPEEHDRKMKEAYDDNYYEAEDVDPEFGSDKDEDGYEFGKPDFDKEDELLGLPEGWDNVSESGDGFASVRERISKKKAESGEDNEQATEGEEDVVAKEGKRKRKRKMPSEVEKAVREQLMDEYYKLDYEDTIGDLKTRFKYKPVKAKRFGLRTEEILMMDDKELNQYVSLKKLAPYREKEWKVPHVKVQQQKERNKALLRGEISETTKIDKKKNRHADLKTTAMVIPTETQEQKTEDSAADTSKLSRGRKRRHNQAELKLSHQRLSAYGKIPSKPKNKK